MRLGYSPFTYLREAYGMPWLATGVHVVALGKRGVITGADQYVHVRLDGEKHAKPYHPNDVKQAEVPSGVHK